ncbi:hypothetical protein L7F22_026559 [Adiantum nelumboides]|nr:hypothetical protein [Adiantum nelumboides]
MPKGNFKQYLSLLEECGTILTWVQRCKIVIGVASALCHLHLECAVQFVHRDVKPSNILLDDDYNAYLSDFGNAIRIADEYKEIYTVTGTWGYMAPEYHMTRQLGPETDVFAFGVVLMQLVCGIEMVPLVTSDGGLGCLKRLYMQGELLNAVDWRVRADVCCSWKAKDRPNMNIVVEVLLGDLGENATPATAKEAPLAIVNNRVVYGVKEVNMVVDSDEEVEVGKGGAKDDYIYIVDSDEEDELLGAAEYITLERPNREPTLYSS